MNQKKRKFRFENKYIVNASEIELLKTRIAGLCMPDEYSASDGEYGIRSLYFDDYSGTAYYENAMGINPREKYRIRIYNCSADVIMLERKIKVNGRISKDRTRIDAGILQAVISGQRDEIEYEQENPLLNRFLQAYDTRYLRPKIIVDYVREAYVSAIDDIRITFDKHISFSEDFESFFEADMFLQPIMPLGKELMEVKFTDYLPEQIHRSLDLGRLSQSTFSKYYLCEQIRRGEY